MKQNKSISSMFTYFTDIINGLKYLVKTYTNSDLIRKVLRSLPRLWEPKVTVIPEAKDLNTYSLDDLLGLLMTHELSMQQRSDEESKKKKTITLKAITSALSEEDSKKSKNEKAEDDDMILLTHKFRKFLKKKDPLFKGKNSYRKPLDRVREKEREKDERKKKNNICYRCNRSRHFMTECLLEKKIFRRKKKALLVAWDDSDNSSSKEEQVEERANLYLMAHDDSEDEVYSNNYSDFTFDELLETFHELMHDSTLLVRKLNDLKIMHKDLNKKLNVAHTNAKVLKYENSVLTSKLHESSNSNHDHMVRTPEFTSMYFGSPEPNFFIVLGF